ncbi:MAG: agmatine deiminase family protein [Pseudomonadota bacterium]
MKRRTFSKSVLVTGLLSASQSLAGSRWMAPAEADPHTATWMSWPTSSGIYGDEAYLESVQEHLGRLARAIARFEPVLMAAPAGAFERVRALCGSGVRPIDVPTNDMWMRDTGPVFLRSEQGGLIATDFNFNGWGGRQAPRKHDEAVAANVADYLSVPTVHTFLVGEGGGLEWDGDGTLLLTDSCWLNDNRNPGISKATMTKELRRLLGVEKVIWLPGVRDQDITDGHIDGAIRFVRPGLIMTGGYPDDDSDWGLALKESRRILAGETDARGRPFDLVDVPSATNPANGSEELFTGYANFYTANGAVFTPLFGDRVADESAVKKLADLFPDREVVALEVDRLYENGGGIHCVTQQQPAV